MAEGKDKGSVERVWDWIKTDGLETASWLIPGAGTAARAVGKGITTYRDAVTDSPKEGPPAERSDIREFDEAVKRYEEGPILDPLDINFDMDKLDRRDQFHVALTHFDQDDGDAVARLQKLVGARVDGIWGPESDAALNLVLRNEQIDLPPEYDHTKFDYNREGSKYKTITDPVDYPDIEMRKPDTEDSIRETSEDYLNSPEVESYRRAAKLSEVRGTTEGKRFYQQDDGSYVDTHLVSMPNRIDAKRIELERQGLETDTINQIIKRDLINAGVETADVERMYQGTDISKANMRPEEKISLDPRIEDIGY